MALFRKVTSICIASCENGDQVPRICRTARENVEIAGFRVHYYVALCGFNQCKNLRFCLTLTVPVTAIDALRHFETG